MSAKQSRELEALASISDIKKGRVCRCGQLKMAGMATCLKCWGLLPRDLRDRLCLRPGEEYAKAYKAACKIIDALELVRAREEQEGDHACSRQPNHSGN